MKQVEGCQRMSHNTGKYFLHQAFEAVVAQFPQKVAACVATDPTNQIVAPQITFEQLNQQANQLARVLQKQQIGPEIIVGVCLERSFEALTAVLAIHKVGGAFLFLDPYYPEERLHFMMEDANIEHVISLSQWQSVFKETKPQTLFLDQIQPELNKEPIHNLENVTQSDDLAYIVYTSGSTGNPKGVMIEHNGLQNRIAWQQETELSLATDHVLHSKPLSFDASYAELLCGLVSGATLIIVPQKFQKDLNAIAKIIKNFEVSFFNIMPSMLTHLLDEPAFAQATHIRTILAGGEALSAQLRDRVLGQFDINLINIYGPSETTIGVAANHCQLGVPKYHVPIGRSISNADLLILDGNNQPVGVETAGELFVGGDVVGRGYINRPKLTNEKFVPHPFGVGTVYRTGDMVQYLPDGSIDFVGRVDLQVKIRGQRIELGEIERCLGLYPFVKETAVVPREDKYGNQFLVAFVTSERCDSLSNEEIRTFLGQSLPDFMVPNLTVCLDKLPLTNRGKVDRTALAKTPITTSHNDQVYVAPETDLEKKIVAIWQEMLQIEKVGIKDNFLDLGGHSLLATKIIMRVEHETGVQMPVRTFFDQPTIEGIITYINKVVDSLQHLQVMDNDSIEYGEEMSI